MKLMFVRSRCLPNVHMEVIPYGSHILSGEEGQVLPSEEVAVDP